MFASLWPFVFYGWFIAEVSIAGTTRTRKDRASSHDGGTLLLLWAVIAASITSATWLGDSRGPNLPRGSGWLEPASVAVMLIGMAIRFEAILTLGKSFSVNVAIHRTQTVKKTGLYRWMRHPSYTGLLLCFLAVGMHTRNWISLLIMVTAPTAALLYRIHVEENVLREHFGEEYVEYSRHTRRLIPGIY